MQTDTLPWINNYWPQGPPGALAGSVAAMRSYKIQICGEYLGSRGHKPRSKKTPTVCQITHTVYTAPEK